MSECTHANHNELVIKTRDGMPDIDTMFELADFFKVFSDSTRIRIMSALFQGELSVCCIAEILNMEQSTISHQLRVLRRENLVKVRKDGKQSYYSLADDHIRQIFEMGLEHIGE
ncbi:MAG: winged helix-turn-helix transcriptional regulator [Ruminococcus sp.]|nr:winged helix-turn-helix transcriptional regulator [Ruminococcus sp.]